MYIAGLNNISSAPVFQPPIYFSPMSINLASNHAVLNAGSTVDADKKTEEERTARILQQVKQNYATKTEEIH